MVGRLRFSSRLLALTGVSVALVGCDAILGLGDYKNGPGTGGDTSSSGTSAGGSGNATTSTQTMSTGTVEETTSSASGSSGTTGGAGGSVPGHLTVDNDAGDFGSVNNQSKSDVQTFTFTNDGGSPTPKIVTELGGTNPDQFILEGDTCNGQAIDVGKTCAIGLVFSPTNLGSASATLTAKGGVAGSPVVNLTGLSIVPGEIGINPTANDFKDLEINSQSTGVDYVITNSAGQPTGTLTTTINDVDGGQFTVTDGCAGRVLPSLTGSCKINVIFSPTTTGEHQLMIGAKGTPGGSVNATATGNGIEHFPLSVQDVGTGSGVVKSGTGDIDCGTTPADSVCSASELSGNVVTLTATPAQGSTFDGWGGACTGTGVCQVTMDQARSVTATFTAILYTVTITRGFVASAGGTVVSTSPASPVIDCPNGSCAQKYPAGTSLKLLAKPTAPYYLQGWSGDLVSTQLSPTVSVNSDLNIKATFTPANLAFVSSKVFAGGNFGGVAGANAECQAEGNAVVSGGHFVAWLSTSTSDAKSLLATSRGWIRPGGLPVADTELNLMSYAPNGHLFYPIRLQTDQTDVGPFATVATGTSGGGIKDASGYFCADWKSTSGSLAGGYADMGTGTWTSFLSTSCTASARVYCFQNDFSAVVTVAQPAANARFMFVSTQNFAGNFGIAGADSMCVSEAQANGLGSNYKALLATTGSSAASRFVAKGVPIVRPDGVVLAASDSTFLSNGTLLASPELAPDGTPMSNYGVWDGASGGTGIISAGTTASTCSDWTSNSASQTGGVGTTSYSAGNAYFGNGTTTCNQTYPHIYCLEL